MYFEQMYAGRVMYNYFYTKVLPHDGGTDSQDPYELNACIAIAQANPLSDILKLF
jgi:hypothetical protein